MINIPFIGYASKLQYPVPLLSSTEKYLHTDEFKIDVISVYHCIKYGFA